MSRIYSESEAITALNQGQFEQAIDIWRMVRRKKGVCCDLTVTDKRCIHCFEGRLLFLALSYPSKNYEDLYRKLRDWREEQSDGFS